MATPIVLQLQELASDSDNSLTAVLRKALLISSKLGLNEFRVWVTSELNGYSDPEAVPAYRRISAQLKAINPFHGIIPFIIDNKEISDALSQIEVSESVESLEHVLRNNDSGRVTFPFSPEQKAIIMKMQDSFAQMEPTRILGTNQIASILEQVRTKLLDWSLNLEYEGILGEGLSFSQEEKQKASNSSSISIQNFQGVLGDVTEGSVSQQMSMTVTPGNFESLADYLRRQKVEDADIKELEDAVRQDSNKPPVGNDFGPAVSSWIAKMVSKAADGGWAVGVASAGNILGSAISKFYGL